MAQSAKVLKEFGKVHAVEEIQGYAPGTTAPGTGNITITSAQLLTGYVEEDPEGNATWTTDTAQDIVANLGGNVRVGSYFDCVFSNIATAASGEVVTLAGGTGVTLRGTALTLTEGTNETALVRFVCTNVTAGSEAVTGFIISGVA